jgi:hypothetical protein
VGKRNKKPHDLLFNKSVGKAIEKLNRIRERSKVPLKTLQPQDHKAPAVERNPKRVVSAERQAFNDMKATHRRVTAAWRRKVLLANPDIGSISFECDICRKKMAFNKVRVDHCHNSMIVRGHLCQNCNIGLGYFKDSTKLMRRAAEYIEQHNERNKGVI